LVLNLVNLTRLETLCAQMIDKIIELLCSKVKKYWLSL